jgi:hypothetical protein
MVKKKPIKRPEKKETLAQKQEKRLRRLNHLRRRLPELSSRWWIRIGEMGGLTVLFLVNFWLLAPFFGRPDRINVFSAPVIPLFANLTESFLSFSYGVRLWLLVFLIFFPLSFYWFVREISGRKLVALISSFIAILPVGIFLPLRVNLGLFGGDGAHMASLTLTPLVCLLLLKFLRYGKYWAGTSAALGTTVVALTSPIGVVVLALFMGVITFSEMLLGRGRLKAVRFFIVLILAIGFSAFWYNPKFAFLTLQSPQGQVVKKTLSTLLPVSFFLLPILGVFGFLLFENRPQLQPMFIAFFLTIGLGLFSLGAGVAHPTPSRFLPAFGIALAFFLGISNGFLFDFFRRSPKFDRFKIPLFQRRIIALGLIGFVFGLMVIIILFSHQSLWELEFSQVLGLATEQKVGVWGIKEKTAGPGSTFGYMITGLTALGVVILKVKLGAP